MLKIAGSIRTTILVAGIAAFVVLAAGVALVDGGTDAAAARTAPAQAAAAHATTTDATATQAVTTQDPALRHIADTSSADDALPVDQLPVVQAEVGFAPDAAPATGRDHRAHVMVTMDVEEKVMTLAPGAEYRFWTFGGSMPGPMVRVRQGDYVTFTLQNPSGNVMPHNIDMHAVTGTGGGAVASMVTPGQQATFSFSAIKSGVFVYHCATAPVGMHIANGMYGLIVVEPKEGYEPVDHEFYVMQGDFYTKADYGAQGMQDFDMQRAIDEDAAYVVFNGAVGSLTGDNALHVQAGDTVRMFVGDGGPNLASSFHVIGEMFDTVHVEGGSLLNHDVQTTMIPPGDAVMVEFLVDVPGTYTLVDHAIFRAFNKGAIGQIVAGGEADTAIFDGDAVVEPIPAGAGN